MKKHLVSISFDFPNGGAVAFTGFVTTRVISISRLFKKAFGYEMPEHTQATIL